MRADSVSLRWRGRGTERVGAQMLVLLDARFGDLRWVMMLALVGLEQHGSYREVLIDNGLRVVGDVVLKDGAYMLRLSALVDALRPAELEELIERVAASATVLRSGLVPPDRKLDCYSWIQD